MTEEATNPETEVETSVKELETEQSETAGKPRDEKGRFTSENQEDDDLDVDLDQLEGLDEEDEPDEEFEEVEYDGKRYSVPKPLTKAIMQHSDYTRKTQELSEKEKRIQSALAEQQQAAEDQQAEFEEAAAVHALRKYLDQFSAIDWNKAVEEDPTAANKQFIEYQTLRSQLQEREQKLQQKRQERSYKAQQEAARREAEGREVLRRSIKGYSPEVETTLKQFAKERGVGNADHFNPALFPQETQILWEAYQYRKLLNKAKAKPANADPKPSKSIPKGGKTAPQGLSDDLSPEEWMKRRRAQQLRNG